MIKFLFIFLILIEIISSLVLPEMYLSKILSPSSPNNGIPTQHPTASPTLSPSTPGQIYVITNTKEKYIPNEQSFQDISSIVYSNYTELPFSFRIFGQTINSLYVHPNGAISASSKLGCHSVPMESSHCFTNSTSTSSLSCDCTEGTITPLISQNSMLDCLSMKVFSFTSNYNDELYAFTFIFSSVCLKDLNISNVKISFFRDSHIEIYYTYVNRVRFPNLPISGLFPPPSLTTYDSSVALDTSPLSLYYLFDENVLKSNQALWGTKTRGYFPLFSNIKSGNSFLICPVSPIFSVRNDPILLNPISLGDVKIDFVTTHLTCLDSFNLAFFYSAIDNINSTLTLLSACIPKRYTDNVVLSCKVDSTLHTLIRSVSENSISKKIYFWPAYSTLSSGSLNSYKFLSENSLFLDFDVSKSNSCSINYNISSTCDSSSCLLIQGDLSSCLPSVCSYSNDKYSSKTEVQLFSPPSCDNSCSSFMNTSYTPFYSSSCCPIAETGCDGTCMSLTKSGFYIIPSQFPSSPPLIISSDSPTSSPSTAFPSSPPPPPTNFPTFDSSSMTFEPSYISPTYLPIMPFSDIDYKTSNEMVCCPKENLDCSGVCYGEVKYDACGICGGSNKMVVYDCLGVCGGSAKYDVCGVCNGNDTIGFSCFNKDMVYFWIKENHHPTFEGSNNINYINFDSGEISSDTMFNIDHSLENLYEEKNITLMIYNTSPYDIILDLSPWNNDIQYFTSGPDLHVTDAYQDNVLNDNDDEIPNYYSIFNPTLQPTFFSTPENYTYTNPLYNNTLNSTGFYSNYFKISSGGKISVVFKVSLDNLMKGYYKRWLFKNINFSFYPIELPKALYSMSIAFKYRIMSGCEFFNIDQCTRVPGCFYCFSLDGNSVTVKKSTKNNQKKKFFLIKSSHSQYRYVETRYLDISNPYSTLGVVTSQNTNKVYYDEEGEGRRLFSSFIPNSLKFFSSSYLYDLGYGTCKSGFDESVCIYSGSEEINQNLPPGIEDGNETGDLRNGDNSSSEPLNLIAIVLPLVIIWVMIVGYFVHYWKKLT